MAIVVVFTLLLVRGTKLGDIAQQHYESRQRPLALLALVDRMLRVRRPTRRSPRRRQRSRRCRTFAAFLLAAQSVIYAYDGWTGPIYFSEELDDPAQQIPRSMFYGLVERRGHLSR